MPRISAIVSTKLLDYIGQKAKESHVSDSAIIRQTLTWGRNLLLESSDEQNKKFFFEFCNLSYTRMPIADRQRVSFNLDEENSKWIKGFRNKNLVLNRIILLNYFVENYGTIINFDKSRKTV